MLTRRVSCRVESALIHFLDERLEVDPYFVCRRLAVPFFKIALVQPTSEEQSDGAAQVYPKVAVETPYWSLLMQQ